MLFPVSGVSVNPLVPFFVAFSVSFFTSMGGVSGAFLLLPFQVSVLGYTSPSVSATNHVFNMIAIPSGVYRYVREGRMLWPLSLAVVIGTLPGVFIGAWLRIRLLPDPKNFKLFVGIVLVYIGGRLLQELVTGHLKHSPNRAEPEGMPPTGPVSVRESSLGRIVFDFDDNTYSFAPGLIYAICFLVGIVGGVYGIGGGAIVAPFFIAIIGLPVHVVAGAALLGTFVTSVAGVIFFHLLAMYYPGQAIAPDWFLGIVLGTGGMLGMYLGARTQKFVPAVAIKTMLVLVILFVAGKYIAGFFG